MAAISPALELGLKEVPTIIMSGLSDTKKRLLSIADNKISVNAGWDYPILAAELGELAVLLPECQLNIELSGFEAAEIDSLMSDHLDSEREPADVVPEVEAKAVSQNWRLMDAVKTSAAVWRFERTRGCQKADGHRPRLHGIFRSALQCSS